MGCGVPNESAINFYKKAYVNPSNPMPDIFEFETRSVLAFANSIVNSEIFGVDHLEELINYLRTYCSFRKPF